MRGITRIRGVLVGHAQDGAALTGCTVVLTPGGAVAGVDVRGSAPGTRETDLMRPCSQVERIHGVALSGGSAYGLDSASGVMRWLEEQGFGFATPFGIVPIAGAAVIYDLGIGNPRVRPDAAMGYAACRAASSGPCCEGNIGAGAGATVGKIQGPQYAMKGGLGTCVAEVSQAGSTKAEPVLVGALVIVNSLGDVVDPWTGRVVAGAYDAGRKKFIGPGVGPMWAGQAQAVLGTNTTIAVVATDAVLDNHPGSHHVRRRYGVLPGHGGKVFVGRQGERYYCHRRACRRGSGGGGGQSSEDGEVGRRLPGGVRHR